jgi:hypothetical protein
MKQEQNSRYAAYNGLSLAGQKTLNPRRAASLTRSLHRYGHDAGSRTASTTSRIELITS